MIRERIGAGEFVYRISGAPDGSGDRVAVQTEAVDGRRNRARIVGVFDRRAISGGGEGFLTTRSL